MKVIDVLCAVVVVIGGINWGMIGAVGFNLIESLSGDVLTDKDDVYLYWTGKLAPSF